MSAVIQHFPANRRTAESADIALRYVRRAQEAFDMLGQAASDGERSALCRVAEIWLDMAESVLPRPRRQGEPHRLI